MVTYGQMNHQQHYGTSRSKRVTRNMAIGGFFVSLFLFTYHIIYWDDSLPIHPTWFPVSITLTATNSLICAIMSVVIQLTSDERWMKMHSDTYSTSIYQSILLGALFVYYLRYDTKVKNKRSSRDLTLFD
jgi:hypothetical protein